MGRYLLRRIIQIVPLLVGITVLTFALVHFVPGSPVDNLTFRPGTAPEDIERIREQLGLNEPVYLQYFHWSYHVIQGDLGLSLVSYEPVTTLILDRLPNTVILTSTALILSLLFSIPIGVYAAIRRNSRFDQAATVGAAASMAVPTFWLGLMMIILFSVKFHEWGLPSLPPGGVADLRDDGGGFWDRVEHLLMPAVALAFVQMAAWTRYIRSQMIEVLRQDYIRVADSKGLSERLVIVRHGMKNAVLPLVTLLALDIPTLFSGAVVVEQIFTWNGIGRLIVDSTFKRDYTVVMGIVLIVSFLTVIANLLADVIAALLDPRIRYD